MAPVVKEAEEHCQVVVQSASIGELTDIRPVSIRRSDLSFLNPSFSFYYMTVSCLQITCTCSELWLLIYLGQRHRHLGKTVGFPWIIKRLPIICLKQLKSMGLTLNAVHIGNS